MGSETWGWGRGLRNEARNFFLFPLNTIPYLLNFLTKCIYYFYHRQFLYNVIILVLFNFRFKAHEEIIMYLFLKFYGLITMFSR